MKKTQKPKTFIAVSLLALFVFSSVIAIVPTQRAQAAIASSAKTYINQDVQKQVERQQMYYWLRGCFNFLDIDKIPSDEMDSWEWFKGASYKSDYDNHLEGMHMVSGGIFGSETDSVLSCEKGSNVQSAWNALGWTKPTEAFCAFSNALINGEVQNFSTCRDGGDDDEWDMRGGSDQNEAVRTNFQNIIAIGGKNDRLGWTGSAPPISNIESLTDEMHFVRAYLTALNGCNLDLIGSVVAADKKATLQYDDGDRYLVPIVDAQGNEGWQVGVRGIEKNVVAMQSRVSKPSGSELDRFREFGDWMAHDNSEPLAGWAYVTTCGEMLGTARDYQAKYATYVKTNPPSADEAAAGTGDSNGGGENDPTCQSEGGPLAWLLCAVIDVIDKSLVFLDEQVRSLLFVDKSVYDNETVTGAWESMRNLALLVLVPMMMFMVIGTALNFGPFDPYTVKKSLPRMFVATIFIVLSLPITQFGVQLSNAVGQGLGNMITFAAPDSANSLKEIFKDSSEASQDGLGLTATVALIGGGAVGGIGALLSFGSVALVGLLIGFAVLILRQVLVILLMVVAPLAILSWIFPGNDKLWGLWKGTMTAMLLMFPIISLLLASGRFVAGIIGS